MMFKRETGRRLGLINHFLRANTKKEPNTEKENTNMQMARYIKEIGVIIKYQDMEYILGLMVRIMKGNGLIIICMVTVHFLGQMAGDTKATT